MRKVQCVPSIAYRGLKTYDGSFSCHGGRGLDDKSASERVDDLDDGTETWVAFFVEAFVETFATDSSFLGDLAHSTQCASGKTS